MPSATPVQFISPHRILRVIRRSAVEQILPGGGVAVTQPEEVYEFNERRFEIREGERVLKDRIDPNTGEISEQDAVEFLRNHPDFNLRFHEITPVAPDPGPLFAEIAGAAVSEDVARLTAIGQEEYDSFNRPEIMDLVRAALDKLDPDGKSKDA